MSRDLPSLEAFLRRHWQRRPLWMPQAVPLPHRPALTRGDLFDLAARDDVESRLIVRDGRRWQLAHGPFTRRRLPPLARLRWTLLVQGVDLHLQAVHELMAAFRFVPDARLDDCMVSFATDGGGVGPHVDSYDVFLLQLAGRRRWRIGPVRDPQFVPGLPVKILRRFVPTETRVLAPGDMLYLPPGWGHDGVADGECITASIGFRAPEAGELAAELLQRWLEAREPRAARRLYRDPPGPAMRHPAQVPPALAEFAMNAVEQLTADRPRLRRELQWALGEWLTEPKAQVVFEPDSKPAPPAAQAAGRALVLDRRTRMMYDDSALYLNGESLRATGRDARLLRELADRRVLPARQADRLSHSARAAVVDWVRHGWAHWRTDQHLDSSGGPT